MLSTRLRQKLLRATLGLGALVFDGRARAQDSGLPVKLDWFASDASCPTSGAVLARTGALLRGSTSTPHPVVARAEVSRRASHWHVEVVMTIEGSRGVRAFDSDTCESVANAAAFALALAVDPMHAPSAPPPPPAAAPVAPGPKPAPAPAPAAPSSAPSPGASPDEARTAEPPAPEPTREVPAEPAAPPPVAPAKPPSRGDERRRGRFGVALGGVLDTATLPTPALGAEVALLWRPAPLRAEVAGLLLPTERASVGPVAGASGAFALWGVAARLCLASALGRFELGPCVAAELDTVSASGAGAGLARTLSDSATWVTAEATGAAAMILAPLALRLSAGPSFPLARPEFVLLSSTTTSDVLVHRASFVSLRAHLAVEVHFL